MYYLSIIAFSILSSKKVKTMNEYPHDKPEFSDQGQLKGFVEADQTAGIKSIDLPAGDFEPTNPKLIATNFYLIKFCNVEARNPINGSRIHWDDVERVGLWNHFDKHPDDVPVMRLPEGVIALVSDDYGAILDYLRPFDTPPTTLLYNGKEYAALLRLPYIAKVDGITHPLPSAIKALPPGTTITLPWGEHFEKSKFAGIPELSYQAFHDPDDQDPDIKTAVPVPTLQQTNDDLPSEELGTPSSTPEVEIQDVNNDLDVPEMEPAAVVVIDTEVAVPDTALTKHSLLGSEDDVAKFAVTAVALIGMVLLMSQFGMIYAEPNTGKTLLVIALLLNAIEEGRLDARLLYYVNADDNAGGLLEKLQLFREVGAHTLVPGYKGFEPENLIDLMLTMIKNRQCIGVVLVIYTLKNFTDLMDKKKSAQLGRVARRFQNAGGTFIGLAHTNKKPGPNGKPIYAGTTDFFEACDVACYILPAGTAPNGDKVVKFELFKRRGGGNQNEAYSFSGASDISYHQLVASVQKIDPDQMQKYEHAGQIIADKLVIDGISNVLRDGPQQKMALARTVAGLTKASRRQVVEILDRYTGSDPAKHKWDFVVAERGAKVFTFHAPMEA